MANKTGTADITNLLAVRNQSIIEYGLDRATEALQASRDTHNALVDDMITTLAERTTERGFVYGANDDGDMIDADEYTRPPTQLPSQGGRVDIPMKRKQYAIGWTNDWFLTKSPADLAEKQLSAESADLRAIQLEIKRAIFGAADYTVRDTLVDNYPLAVKRFVNADGDPIPNGPNNEAYDGATHTHYDGAVALSNAAIAGLLSDVIEHGHGGDIKLTISQANEAAVRGLTDFKPYLDPRVVPSNAADRAAGTLDITRTNNRAIGIIGPAEVIVKPWAITDYYFAYDQADPRKPLAFREPVNAALRGLRIVGENPAFPLLARFMERRFGVGVRTRTNGAVLYVSGGGTYASPNI